MIYLFDIKFIIYTQITLNIHQNFRFQDQEIDELIYRLQELKHQSRYNGGNVFLNFIFLSKNFIINYDE